MGTTAKDVIRKGLEGRLAALIDEYVAADNQWKAALSDVDRVRLKRLVNDRQKQMIDADQELKDFERAENDPNRRQLHVTEHLPKIDFKEIKKTLERIFDKLGRKNFAVIFLLQKGFEFGGDLCAAAHA